VVKPVTPFPLTPKEINPVPFCENALTPLLNVVEP